MFWPAFGSTQKLVEIHNTHCKGMAWLPFQKSWEHYLNEDVLCEVSNGGVVTKCCIDTIELRGFSNLTCNFGNLVTFNWNFVKFRGNLSIIFRNFGETFWDFGDLIYIFGNYLDTYVENFDWVTFNIYWKKKVKVLSLIIYWGWIMQ